MKVYPVTHINVHLPKEPATCNRSYCLRQLSPTQWQTAYYNEDSDCFYYSHYHLTFKDACEAFRVELNGNMQRMSRHVELFYKYRGLIAMQEKE